MSNSVRPPYANRGVIRTEQSALRALVDWVSCTFNGSLMVQDICNLIGYEIDDFSQMERGRNGYKNMVKNGGIEILYNGADGMGIHLNISGQGCREFEEHSKMDWRNFFAMLFTLDSFKLTRLDLAIDDFSGHFSVNTLKNKAKRGEVKSRYSSARSIEKITLADGSYAGETIYFGSPKSETQIRFYDKYQERLAAGKEIQQDIKYWLRCEIQLRNEKATAAALNMAYTSGEIGHMIKQILKHNISFLIKNPKDSNKRRWKVAKFWTNFLGDVQPLALSLEAPDRTIERTYNWISDQVSTSIAMIKKAMEDDPEVLNRIVEEGEKKFKKHHTKMIEKYKENKKDQSAKD